jgi:hypothetical protein
MICKFPGKLTDARATARVSTSRRAARSIYFISDCVLHAIVTALSKCVLQGKKPEIPCYFYPNVAFQSEHDRVTY